MRCWPGGLLSYLLPLRSHPCRGWQFLRAISRLCLLSWAFASRRVVTRIHPFHLETEPHSGSYGFTHGPPGGGWDYWIVLSIEHQGFCPQIRAVRLTGLPFPKSWFRLDALMSKCDMRILGFPSDLFYVRNCISVKRFGVFEAYHR